MHGGCTYNVCVGVHMQCMHGGAHMGGAHAMCTCGGAEFV